MANKRLWVVIYVALMLACVGALSGITWGLFSVSDDNRTALIRICDVGDVVNHQTIFWQGLLKSPPPKNETPAQKKIRLAFKALVTGDLAILKRSEKACDKLKGGSR